MMALVIIGGLVWGILALDTRFDRARDQAGWLSGRGENVNFAHKASRLNAAWIRDANAT
jgi:hypothetical protein